MGLSKELNYEHNCGWVQFIYEKYLDTNKSRKWLSQMFSVKERELTGWLKRYGVKED